MVGSLIDRQEAENMVSLLVVALIQTSGALPAQQREGSIGSGGVYLVPYTRSTSQTVEAPDKAPPPGDMVIVWNEATLQAIKTDKTPPPKAARNLAMVHAAIYDAVNSIQRTHKPYRIDARPPTSTSADAAVAVAAHRVLLDLYPKQAPSLNALLKQSLLGLPSNDAKSDGVSLGQFIAEKMLDWRAEDGSNRKADYEPPSGPGLWSPTLPDFTPALFPQWSKVPCFAMRSSDQFRPKGPPALNSEAYTAAYLEVKKLGAVDSKERTKEQTEIARFWADGTGTVTPPGHWNRVAQSVAQARGNTLADNARLFALLNIAMADAGISCWDCKYKYNLWRPVQAIREADADGNNDTLTDRQWVPLLVTPPFPAYTSGHSSFSAAAATVLARFFGTDEVRFDTTSDGLPNVTRSFTSFSAAAAEAGQSRIYGGIHWQFDNADGLAAGRAVSDHICTTILLPNKTPVSSR